MFEGFKRRLEQNKIDKLVSELRIVLERSGNKPTELLNSFGAEVRVQWACAGDSLEVQLKEARAYGDRMHTLAADKEKEKEAYRESNETALGELKALTEKLITQRDEIKGMAEDDAKLVAECSAVRLELSKACKDLKVSETRATEYQTAHALLKEDAGKKQDIIRKRISEVHELEYNLQQVRQFSADSMKPLLRLAALVGSVPPERLDLIEALMGTLKDEFQGDGR